jgi:hypothetical protein
MPLLKNLPHWPQLKHMATSIFWRKWQNVIMCPAENQGSSITEEEEEKNIREN